jgi:8-oxo-dGTP diphosphatase
VIEETGLDVVVGPIVEVVDRVQRAPDGRVEYHFVIVDYLCTVQAGVVAHGSDASDVRWVSVSELSDYRVTDKAIEVILKAVDLQTR